MELLLEREWTASDDAYYQQARKWHRSIVRGLKVQLDGRPEWDQVQEEISNLKADIKQNKTIVFQIDRLPNPRPQDIKFRDRVLLFIADAEQKLLAAKERAEEIKVYYSLMGIDYIVFDSATQRWQVNLGKRFWNAVRMGQKKYFPGMAADLFYRAALKTWQSVARAVRNAKGRWKSTWNKLLPSDYSWVGEAEDALRALKAGKPKQGSPEFVAQGKKVEKKYMDVIDASLTPYYDYLSTVIAPSYNIVGNYTSIPVSKRILLYSALKPHPSPKFGGIASVGYAWAKHHERLPDIGVKRQRVTQVAPQFVDLGMKELKRILSLPGVYWTRYKHVTFGPVLDIRYGGKKGETLGPGVRFSADGATFITFLDEFDIDNRQYLAAWRQLGKSFDLTKNQVLTIYPWWLRRAFGAARARAILSKIGGRTDLLESFMRDMLLFETTTTANVASRDVPWEWEFDDEDDEKKPATVKASVSEAVKLGLGSVRVLASRLVEQELKNPKTGRTLKKSAERRVGEYALPYTHPQVKDQRGHFKLNTIGQARNALARVKQYDNAPKWFTGSLEQLVKIIQRKVHAAYPSIAITKESLGAVPKHIVVEAIRDLCERTGFLASLADKFKVVKDWITQIGRSAERDTREVNSLERQYRGTLAGVERDYFQSVLAVNSAARAAEEKYGADVIARARIDQKRRQAIAQLNKIYDAKLEELKAKYHMESKEDCLT